MALFRRKSETAQDPIEVEESPLADASVSVTPHAMAVDDGETVTTFEVPAGGPWDSETAPDDDLPRLDLGALLVPIVEGIEMNIEAHPETGAVTGVNYAIPDIGIMQISVFAAPRTSGIWDEVRGEIIESAGQGGGTLTEVRGSLGMELRGQVPTDQPGQLAPARFIGVDGPRWFARAVLSGEPAQNDEMGDALLALFRMCVVNRGTEAMPVRDVLPMAVPREVQQAAEEFAASQVTSDDLNPFERGPEITEIH